MFIVFKNRVMYHKSEDVKNMNIEEIYKTQKAYFNSFETRNVEKRKDVLTRIMNWLEEHEDDINQALKLDLGKTRAEAYLSEIGLIYDAFSVIEKNIDKWTKRRKVGSPIRALLFRSFTVYEPYGTVLVMSPWNYPYLLSMEPVLYAIAAGNTVVLKPSEYAPNTAEIFTRLAEDLGEPGLLSVIQGDARTSRELLTYKWDYIFFTGSTSVGKVVYKRAAENLIPVTLELGGKSPTIVTNSIDIDVAAKRIAFGKFLNAGQTCVAPDYVFVHESVKDQFIDRLKHYIHEFFGDNPLESESLCKIINRKHFNRLLSLVDHQNILIGGSASERSLKIAPTVIDGVQESDAIMQQEIFGPILPVMTYQDIDEVIAYINNHPKPLALYLFTEDKEIQDKVLDRCSFGGGCINDTIMHLSDHDLPFGGVGDSGIGAYHGNYSFETFSHEKSVLTSSTKRDINFRYYPLTEDKEYQIRKQLK